MSLPWQVFVLVGLAAGCTTDLGEGRLPNWLALLLATGGLLHALLEPAGLPGQALLSLLLGGSLLLPAYALGGLAAGDVKFFAGLSTFLAPRAVLAALLIASLIGGGLAFVQLWRAWSTEGAGPGRLRLPYGLALAGGFAWALVGGPI